MGGQTVVEVPTQTDVEGPIRIRDLILNVERKLFYVRVAVKGKQTATACKVVWQQIRTRGKQSDAIHKAGIAVPISERRKQTVIHDSQVVTLIQERLLVRSS